MEKRPRCMDLVKIINHSGFRPWQGRSRDPICPVAPGEKHWRRAGQLEKRPRCMDLVKIINQFGLSLWQRAGPGTRFAPWHPGSGTGGGQDSWKNGRGVWTL